MSQADISEPSFRTTHGLNVRVPSAKLAPPSPRTHSQHCIGRQPSRADASGSQAEHKQSEDEVGLLSGQRAKSAPSRPRVRQPTPRHLAAMKRKSSPAVDGFDRAQFGDAVEKAVAKADEFWRLTTSGSRGYIQSHPFLNLFCFTETVIPGVLKRIDLYVYVAFYLIVLWMRASMKHPDQTVLEKESAFSHSLLTALTSGMTFYLGFYNTSIWTRYDDQWKFTMVAASRISDLNVLLGTYVDDVKIRNDVMRFVNVYHHLVYLEQGGVSLGDALKLAVLRRLLTRAEADRLEIMECDVSERLLIWSSSRIHEHRQQGLEPVMRKHLIDLILQVQSPAVHGLSRPSTAFHGLPRPSAPVRARPRPSTPVHARPRPVLALLAPQAPDRPGSLCRCGATRRSSAPTTRSPSPSSTTTS